MKNSLKKIGYKLSATLLLLTFFQTVVHADDGTRSNDSMSITGVIAGVALIVALVILPAFKGARRSATQE